MKNVQIRLNERRYDESVFLNGGIEHIDLQVVTLRTSVPRSLRPSVPPSLGPSVPPSFPFLSFLFCCPPPPHPVPSLISVYLLPGYGVHPPFGAHAVLRAVAHAP